MKTFAGADVGVARKTRGLICTSITAGDVPMMELLGERALREGSDLIEFRLDSLNYRDPRIITKGLSSMAEHCIMTARPEGHRGGQSSDGDGMFKLLMGVGDMKPAFIDIELGAALRHPRLAGELRGRCGRLIVSWHDHAGTPPVGELKKTSMKALKAGDISKIATTARSLGDNGGILSLYREVPKGKLVAFCMGREGRISRVLCLFAGSPFTYACLEGRLTAPGQIPLRILREMLESFG